MQLKKCFMKSKIKNQKSEIKNRQSLTPAISITVLPMIELS